MFTGKQLCWNLFSIKLQVLRHEILLKIYCKEGGFSENITKLLRTGFFHRASPVNAFEGLCHKQRHFLQTKEKTGTVLSCNFQVTAGHILLVLKKRRVKIEPKRQCEVKLVDFIQDFTTFSKKFPSNQKYLIIKYHNIVIICIKYIIYTCCAEKN